MENLFIQSQEVQKELPKETELFKEIDKDMKKIMKEGCEIKTCTNFCTPDINN